MVGQSTMEVELAVAVCTQHRTLRQLCQHLNLVLSALHVQVERLLFWYAMMEVKAAGVLFPAYLASFGLVVV